MMAQVISQGRRRGFRQVAASATIALGLAFGLAAPAGAVEIDDPRQIEPVSPPGGNMGVAGGIASGFGNSGAWNHALRSPARMVSPDGSRIGWAGTGASPELHSPDNYFAKAIGIRTDTGWRHHLLDSDRVFEPYQLGWTHFVALGDQFNVAVGEKKIEREYPLRPARDVELETGVIDGPWPNATYSGAAIYSGQSYLVDEQRSASVERGGLPLRWPFIYSGAEPLAVGDEIFFDTPNQLAADAPSAATTFDNNSPLQAYVRPIEDGAPVFIGHDATGALSTSSTIVTVAPGGRRVLLRVTDTSNQTRIILLDRDENTRKILGVGPSAVDNAAASFEFSSDGSAVMIHSATQLMASDTDSRRDIYRYDIAAEELIHITINPANGTGNSNGGATCGTLSQCHVTPLGANADGSIVYFSGGEELVPGGPSRRNQVFRWDLAKLKANEMPFEALPVALGNSAGTAHGVAETGDLYMQVTSAGEVELPEWANRGTREVVTYNVESGETHCLVCDGAYATGLATAADFNQPPTILGSISARFFSDDGRFVAVTTNAPLSPSDQNGAHDVYLFDTHSQESTRISEGSGRRGAQFYAMDADASKVFFVSNSALGSNQGVYLDGVNRLYVSDSELEPLARPADPDDAGCEFNCRAVTGDDQELEFASGRDSSGSVKPGVPGVDRRVVVRASQARGARAVLRLRLPSAGRVQVRGAGIRAVGRRTGAGRVNVVVRLKPRHRAALQRRGRLVTGVRVRFKPRSGAASSRAVRVRFVTSSRNGGR